MIIFKCMFVLIFFISLNAFSQSENTYNFVLSDDFICNVDFETNNGSIYLVNVKTTRLNEGYNFLLDNGCPETFISESLAKELNFKPTQKSSIIDIFDKQEKLPTGYLDFIISGVLFRNIKTVILPDESFEFEHNVRGILGLNLIKKCVWSISLKKGISISSNVLFFPVKEYCKQKLHRKHEIKCNFQEGDTITAFFDLGMEAFFNINSKYIDFVGKMKVRNAYSSQAFDGAIFSYQNAESQKSKTKSALAMVKGFSLFGDSIVKNAIIDIDYTGYSFMTIGSHILYCYDIILDVKHKAFYSHNFKTQLNQTKNYGFGYNVLDSMVIVNFIYENSSAENLGILLNDTIEAINNKPIFEITHNVEEYEYINVIVDELYKKDEASLKIKRINKPIFIQKEYLFKN